MNKLTLIGFADCPNTPRARDLLEELGIKYKVKIISESESKQIPEFFGSPSFLFNGKNIEEGSHSWSCRLVDWEKLKVLLLELVNQGEASNA
ncbi:MAG TPA: glutathione S-transferase N-terminal domain-containing protein [Candidatus Woesebacteria bacterium]|nr:glutathione S-transferase N-terminal domain-containing protein [Candidatus Woesebacteria bacterium]